MKSFIQIAIAVFTLALPQANADTLSNIQKSKELKVGVDPGFIPFEMKTPAGDWVGFDVEMVSAFAKEIGANAKFIDTKWEGIIPSLMAKKFDVVVSGMTITEERAKVIRFSDPYYAAGLTALVAQKSAKKIKSVADLNKPGVELVVKLGTTGDLHASKAFPKAKLTKLDSESDAASAVLLGKFDAFIYDVPYLTLYAKRNDPKVSILSEKMTAENFGLAARKNDKALVEKFNEFLKKWRTSGSYDAAIKKHFVEMPWLKYFPELK